MVVDGSWSPDFPAIGGAGIVLIDGGLSGAVVGQRYCGFKCHGSQDAEYQAIARAHLWCRDALIYSDALFVVRRLQGYRGTRTGVGLKVRYLRHDLRSSIYQQAHALSVQGRRTAENALRAREASAHGQGDLEDPPPGAVRSAVQPFGAEEVQQLGAEGAQQLPAEDMQQLGMEEGRR